MVVVHSAGLIAIDVTPLSMVGDCWWHGERQLARESAAIPWRALAQSQGSGRHEESQEGDPSHELHHLEHPCREHSQTHHMALCWNDNRENLEVKIDKLSYTMCLREARPESQESNP